MKAITKVAAVLCGATTMLAMGASMTAFAADPVIFGEKKEINIADIPADRTITYSVSISGNEGYAGSGINVTYDARLEVPHEGVDMEYEQGSGSSGLLGNMNINVNKNIVGWASAATKNCKGNGEIFIFEVVLPADAAVGDEYPMVVDVTKFTDSDTVPLTYTKESGYIRIVGETTTSATTTESTSSETTTTESTSGAPGTESTTDESSTEAPGTESTTDGTETTTSGTETTVEGTDDTTTESSSNGGNGGNGGGNQGGVKTGDAGVALAVAGLMAAAGAAYVIRRKH